MHWDSHTHTGRPHRHPHSIRRGGDKHFISNGKGGACSSPCAQRRTKMQISRDGCTRACPLMYGHADMLAKTDGHTRASSLSQNLDNAAIPSFVHPPIHLLTFLEGSLFARRKQIQTSRDSASNLSNLLPYLSPLTLWPPSLLCCLYP